MSSLGIRMLFVLTADPGRSAGPRATETRWSASSKLSCKNTCTCINTCEDKACITYNVETWTSCSDSHYIFTVTVNTRASLSATAYHMHPVYCRHKCEYMFAWFSRRVWSTQIIMCKFSAAVMINKGGRIRLMTGCLDMLVILLLISVLQKKTWFVETHWKLTVLTKQSSYKFFRPEFVIYALIST